MKTLISAAMLMLIATVAFADEAIYNKYISKIRHASHCHAFADTLTTRLFETLIEKFGEDIAVEVMDIGDAYYVEIFKAIADIGEDDTLTKVWKKRLLNDHQMAMLDGVDEGYINADNRYEVSGIEATVETFFKKCR